VVDGECIVVIAAEGCVHKKSHPWFGGCRGREGHVYRRALTVTIRNATSRKSVQIFSKIPMNARKGEKELSQILNKSGVLVCFSIFCFNSFHFVMLPPNF
jgi:hypothetical protein